MGKGLIVSKYERPVCGKNMKLMERNEKLDGFSGGL